MKNNSHVIASAIAGGLCVIGFFIFFVGLIFIDEFKAHNVSKKHENKALQGEASINSYSVDQTKIIARNSLPDIDEIYSQISAVENKISLIQDAVLFSPDDVMQVPAIKLRIKTIEEELERINNFTIEASGKINRISSIEGGLATLEKLMYGALFVLFSTLISLIFNLKYQLTKGK